MLQRSIIDQRFVVSHPIKKNCFVPWQNPSVQMNKKYLLLYRSIIVQVCTETTMMRDNHDGTISRISAYFYTATRLINKAQVFDISDVLSELNMKTENFNKRGSSFILQRITRYIPAINAYRPLQRIVATAARLVRAQLRVSERVVA